ncbi:MAG: LamG domain-containing protein [Pirellulales bacterium]
MIRTYQVHLALIFSALWAADAAAGNIGINFRRGTGQEELALFDSAGFVPQISWNNTSGATSGNNANIASPSPGILVDEFNDPTPVTISWTANTTWSAPNGTATGDAKLMSGYIDNINVRTPTRVDIANIPFAHYDVIAYVGSDQANTPEANRRLGHVGIIGRGGSYYRTITNPFTAYSTNPTPTASNVAANYITFPGLSESSFTVMNTRLSNNVGLHGLQIIERFDAPTPPPAAPARDQVGYWSFNQSDARDDSTYQENDATLNGNATFGPGQFGVALVLDGTRDYAQVLAPTARLKPTDTIALSAWVKNEEANSQGEILSLGDHYGLRIQADGTVRFLVDYRPDGNGWLDPTTSVSIATEKVINDGLWHHIVGQKTDTSVEIYIDGVRAASAGASFPTIVPIDYNQLGQSLFFGAHGNGSTGFDFQGRVDEVRIFHGSLTQDMVTSLFRNNVIPEPSAGVLLLFGLIAAGVFRCRRRG